MNEKDSPLIFILSWNRPIYLWVCLDSIYRLTKHPCRIVLADNNSSDPLVHDVIDGFERRGMFYKVHRYDKNDPFRFKKLINEYWDEINEYFVLIEADIEVMPLRDTCWLTKMTGYMDDNSNLASVGSRVYKRDFISMDEARKLRPDLSEEELGFLIKTEAPMRKYKNTSESLIEPHNAPLRLLMMRKDSYSKIDFGRDRYIYLQFKKLGYDAKISTDIVHRHLSLLNIYDYPIYGKNERNDFFDVQSSELNE